jgi:hypothetical protein
MPFGESDPKAIAEAKKRDQASLPVSDENLRKMAMNILGQSGLDKSQLTLTADKPSADQVVFKNGQGGSIKLALVQVDLPPGMTATLDKNDLSTGDQAVLKVSYTPNGKDKAPANFMLQLIMEPFSRVFPVTVHFTQTQ